MAQKSQKQLAARNAATLRRTHLISLAVNALFVLLRVLVFRRSLSRASLLRYVLLSAPAWAIQASFERTGRPAYAADGTGLHRAGEDLDAKGLTEWMWDVLYWTWGCVATAALLGDWVWWAYLAVPLYSAWLAWTTFGSVRRGLGMGVGGEAASDGGETKASGQSKRQAKLEKRGGQRMQYKQ